MASLERVDDILKAEDKLAQKPDAVQLQSFEQAIRFEKVWFKYKEKWVLRDVDLEIPKGKTIALVGQSGSGKSTLVDLIPRFYDVNEGAIYLSLSLSVSLSLSLSLSPDIKIITQNFCSNAGLTTCQIH